MQNGQKRRSGSKGNGYRGWTPKRKAQQKAVQQKRHDFVREAKSKPCTDCGIQYPYYVMQFDHCRGTKELQMDVRTVARTGLERLTAEIAKCDVVCANCHAERTQNRS